MKKEIWQHNATDADGNPAGGFVQGEGLFVIWQDGALSVDGVRKEPNGAFVEDLIRACIGRLEFYQDSKFACGYNAEALYHLSEAHYWLEKRTKDREERGVEGTHQV